VRIIKDTMPPEWALITSAGLTEKRAPQCVPPQYSRLLVSFLYFLILAALYESGLFRLCVLLSVPIAVFGAFCHPLSSSFRHFIFFRKQRFAPDRLSAIGLAARTPSLIRWFAKAGHEHGKSLLDCALEGAKLRLAPC